MTTHSLFDRPELLESQTRLILSADAKPKRLVRSGTRSAGYTNAQDRPDSAISINVIQETDDELLDEKADKDFPVSPSRQVSILFDEVDYDTDLEQEEEQHRDQTCHSIYKEQCRRHGVIPSTHFLRHLNSDVMTIRYCGLKPVNVKVMIPSLKINSTITKLDLEDNNIGSRGATYITYLIKENEFIDELNLANNDIGLQGCKALCEVLVSNRSIRILNLCGNRFNDDCAPHFAEIFAQNEHLTYINLNKNHFESEITGRLFGKALMENETLEQVHLSWNHLNSKACAFILKSLASNERIITLDLSWNGAELAAAKAVNDLLRKNTVLQNLYLEYNRFNTECATHIGKGLSKNESLKILTLRGNPLESSGCYALLHPLVKHTTCQLQKVDLRDIIINNDCIELVNELHSVLSELFVRLGTEGEKCIK